MTIKDKKTVGETTKSIWDGCGDITKQSPDRPFPLKLEIGVVVYLNKEQYAHMMEEKWQEKRERYLNGRCSVSAERGGLKRCTKNCMNYDGEGNICPWFMHPKANGGIVSLDELYDNNEYEVADPSYQAIEDVTEHENQIKTYRQLLDELEDETDRRIIELLEESYSERKIASELGWDQMKVHRRKTKIFNELRSKLEKLK